MFAEKQGLEVKIITFYPPNLQNDPQLTQKNGKTAKSMKTTENDPPDPLFRDPNGSEELSRFTYHYHIKWNLPFFDGVWYESAPKNWVGLHTTTI